MSDKVWPIVIPDKLKSGWGPLFRDPTPYERETMQYFLFTLHPNRETEQSRPFIVWASKEPEPYWLSSWVWPSGKPKEGMDIDTYLGQLYSHSPVNANAS